MNAVKSVQPAISPHRDRHRRRLFSWNSTIMPTLHSGGLSPLNERVAALEAVQARHNDDITKLSDKIDSLAREQRTGIAALSDQIREVNSSRARTVTAAITGGGAVGGSVAVGLYQLIRFLYPHLFGG